MKDQNDRLDKFGRDVYLRRKGIKPNSPAQLDMFEIVSNRHDLRHLPNDYARSSLFTASNRNKPRKTMMREALFHYNENISIHYTGVELRASDDEIVWLQILAYGKDTPLGEPFEFLIKDLVKDLGWFKNGRNYERARECISRLKASEVLAKNINAYGKSAALSLIQNYQTNNDAEGNQSKYRVWIDYNLIVLFAGNTFTSHNWEKYRKLSPVARRLADWIVSHKNPYPLNIEKFRKICGSVESTTYGWRRTVKNACEEIKDAGIANTVYVKDDKICCIRYL